MAGLTHRVSLSGATILHLHHLVHHHHLLLLLLLLLLPFSLPGDGGVASAQRAGRDCPRACTCYHREEVHCTFRYLSAVPAGLPRDALRINMGWLRGHGSSSLLS
ncbi:unnamed protein product [Lampetra planeri]